MSSGKEVELVSVVTVAPPHDEERADSLTEEKAKSPNAVSEALQRLVTRAPWLVVVGACVAMLGLGAQATWSTLSVFISSPGMLAEPASVTIWTYAVAGATSPVSMMLAPRLHSRIGLSATAALGAVLAGGGLIGSAFSPSLLVLILTFGLTFGLGNGLVYNSSVVAAQSWYPKHRGAIGGLVLACFGASAFCYNLLANALANPNNIPTRPPPEGSDESSEAWEEMFHREAVEHVPHALLVIGGMTMIMGLLGSIFIRPAPTTDTMVRAMTAVLVPAKVLSPMSISMSSTPSPSNSPRPSLDVSKVSFEIPDPDHINKMMREQLFKNQLHSPPADMPPVKMMRTPQFWLLYAVEAFGITASLIVLGSFADFAKREGTFNAPFALIGGLAALSNAGGRLAFGALADAIDYRRTFVVDLSLLTALLFVYFTTRTNLIAFGIVTCAIWTCYGGLMALLPTAVADSFGTRYHSSNYGIVYTSLAIGSLVQALLLTTLLEVFGTYKVMFWMMGGLAFVANIGMLAWKPPGKGKWFALNLSYRREVASPSSPTQHLPQQQQRPQQR